MSATDQRPVTAPPRAARVATWSYFGLNGFAVGMWVVHIPSIEQRTGITHSTLGLLLLVLGGAAFTGMQVAGPLVDRLGQRRLVPAAGVLLGIALAGPGLATNWWTLGLTLILVGFGNGSIDVGMNAQAVVVERGYPRPIMAAFHAMWSIGGAIAAVVGAATLRAKVPTEVTLGLSGLLCIGIALAASRFLLEATVPPEDVVEGERVKPPAKLVWALGGLAFGLMLSEGVANDWAALHFRDILGTSVSTAAYAYGSFAVAMTVGRFLTDRVAAVVGPAAIVRWGAAMAAVGLTVVIVVPSVPVGLVGWAVFGLGLAGGVPQLFTAAGNLDPRSSGALMARVVGMGYVGLLAGPALIGGLAHWMPLNLAFILPVVLCVLTFFGGPVLKSRR
ncbi:MFS transporter [Kribbella sp. NPDC026611]|uniref:MFS transporter n=1 Tax=Kribbella sp. NPDC026611 TaxID=3154911 RepID=UPI0033E8E0C3